MKGVKKGKKKGKKKAVTGVPAEDAGDFFEDQDVNMAEPVDPKITNQPANAPNVPNAQASGNGPLKIDDPEPLKIPE